MSKDLIHGRLKAAGVRVGANVHAHRLRHTCATQLLNAGCPVTGERKAFAYQKLMGHKKLNTTMIYARAHDQTVEADYFAAMTRVEQRLLVVAEPEMPPAPVVDEQRTQILAIAEQLAAPQVEPETRCSLLEQIRSLLYGTQDASERLPAEANNLSQSWIPPPASVLADIETARS